ncbi:CDP-alcohol phosphatidyltransferase, partial [Flavobacteriales bacterium]|nr:CDP-alcohol phosphatidyltransferase [Flavobacteriales bacterium]
LDPKAYQGSVFPKWFMTALSTFGLGFQLLLIAVLLVFELQAFILPFFLAYTFFIMVFIAIRKKLHVQK